MRFLRLLRLNSAFFFPALRLFLLCGFHFRNRGFSAQIFPMYIALSPCLPNLRSIGLLLCLFGFAVGAPAQTTGAGHGPLYRMVNKTGKFADAECFWSLNAGQEWHSLAKEPTVPCPLGNGRLYFRLGPAPKNMADRDAIWDFIEYASENSETWHGNTTQVDAFGIPITIAMGNQRVGITESRRRAVKNSATWRTSDGEARHCGISLTICSACIAVDWLVGTRRRGERDQREAVSWDGMGTDLAEEDGGFGSRCVVLCCQVWTQWL